MGIKAPMPRDRESTHEIGDADPYQTEGRPLAGTPAEVEAPAKPMCPSCGWSNTRPSFSRGPLDSIFEVFGVRAFRCRSCGNRFRTFHRVNSSQ